MFSWFRRIWRQSENQDEEKGKFPAQQLFILALCRICEPIAFMSIFPYVYYMVDSFHVTEDSHKIALWTGAVTSAFTFAEFSTGLFWGRMSDSFGRKPVLIMGLVGTAFSMIVFGFSSNLPMALVARALGGFLNGNIGVLQTTVAELVTDKKHQARAYSIMPSVWCLGSIIGPAMGGALAQPCDNYPSIFPRGTILDQYPFLLPNLVCVIVLVFGITVGVLFLEETHVDKKMRRDRGLELGRWLTAKLTNKVVPGRKPVVVHPDRKDHEGLGDTTPFLGAQDPPPGYRSTENSPLLTTSVPEPPSEMHETAPKPKRSFSRAFTPNVIFVVVGYGILAYHSVSFDQLMPIFLSTPVSDEEPALPLKFVGGLGLTTKSIGFMLAVQGVYSLLAQLWLFPFLVRKFGTLNCYRFVLSIWPLLYFCVPYLIILPHSLQIPAVYFSLISKITLHVIAFPSNAMLLANAAPSNAVLGSINGVAASTASLSRAFGPTVTGYLHSSGLQWGYSGLAWWVCGIVCAVGATESFWVREENNREGMVESEKPDNSEDHDCEAAVGEYRDGVQPHAASNEQQQQIAPLPSSSRNNSPAPLSQSRSMSSISDSLDGIPDLELPAHGLPHRSSYRSF